MNPITDIKDWLGGYPYEYASFQEIVEYIKNLNSNFKLIKYKETNDFGTNEFLFKKLRNDENYN